jgi:PAS domain S-box-containing protein
MAIVFNPAIALMNRLKYLQKFTLISILFAVPLAFVMTLLILQITTELAVAQKERSGIVYLRPLRNLLVHALTERRLANEYLNGNETLKEQLLGNQAQIDQDFMALQVVDQQLGGALKTTGQLSALEASWGGLKDRVFNLRSRQSDDLHTKLIVDVHELIALVGDASNLILDSELESYYTMEAVLVKLPEGQDLIAQTQLLGELAILHNGLTDGDKVQLSTLNGLVESHISATGRGIRIAFRDNPLIQSALASPLQEYTAATEAFLLLVRKDIIFARSISLQSQAYTASAAKAFDANLELWDRSSTVLDHLLQARITKLNQQKYLVIGVTSLGLLFVVYLWVAFYLSVMRTVAKLDEAATRMTSGDMAEMVQLDNRDELGRIARSFNDIATALIAAGSYRQAVVDNAVDGIMTIDEQGAITSFNPAAMRIFGYAATDVIGQSIQMLIPAPYDHECRIVGLGREVIGRRQDGITFPLDLAVGEMHLGGQHAFIGIVHDLTERKRAEAEQMRLQEQVIRAQAATLAELSTPLIPISDQVVVMPLIGAIDSQRAQRVLQALLHGAERSRARFAILDITGVPVVDTEIAQALMSAALGVRLLGAQMVLTGIRPEVAETMVGLGVDLNCVVTRSTLQQGVAFAANGGR